MLICRIFLKSGLLYPFRAGLTFISSNSLTRTASSLRMIKLQRIPTSYYSWYCDFINDVPGHGRHQKAFRVSNERNVLSECLLYTIYLLPASLTFLASPSTHPPFTVLIFGQVLQPPFSTYPSLHLNLHSISVSNRRYAVYRLANRIAAGHSQRALSLTFCPFLLSAANAVFCAPTVWRRSLK